MTDGRNAGAPDELDDRRDRAPIPARPASAEADTIAVTGGPGPSRQAGGALFPGQCIGPYRIERLLGSGGMGEVYAAEHQESGHRLAVKVLPSSESWSSELRARFTREGTLAATINHPNSLYVYGTAEVAGVPLIAMELAPGGTLLDRVDSRGPLAVPAAVDAALQLIAGLQAALDAGILHRDVKPANCFVDRNGHVKIGDYGLSLPTASATDSRLTVTGTVMATPAFAPPEQLRGEDVDVRADLYAVGATLYYLLTGKVPLEVTGAMQMVAAVLERIPESPRRHRPEIPDGLSSVVLRCLRKDPAERYQSYAALRRELVPFSSAVPFSAPVGSRFTAGCLDWLLLGFISGAATLFWSADVSPRQSEIRDLLVFIAVGFAYSIPEAKWGGSAGKRLAGLRVVRTAGGRAGWRDMLLRTAAFLGPAVLLEAAVMFLPRDSAGQQLLAIASLFSPLLLFLPWRGAARHRGWHDRLSRTLVVEARLEAEPATARSLPPAGDQREYTFSIGPYSVATDPAGARPGQVLIALDRTLRRSVWIVIQPADAPHLPQARRDLSRESRLRWLHGRRSPALSWDAFEAPEGHALFAAHAAAEPWPSVRRWLMELAAEAQQAIDEGDVGSLAAGRVWVTTGGSVVVLDFPPPGGEPPAAAHAADAADASPLYDPLARAQDVLSRVARRALLGAADPEPGSSRAPELPLPLYMARVLAGLSAGRYASCASLINELRASMQRPERITGRRRALQFAAPALLFFIVLVPPIIVMMRLRETIERQHPGFRQATDLLAEVRRLERRTGPVAETRRRDLQLYVVGELGSVIRDSSAVLVVRGEGQPLFDRIERFQIRRAFETARQTSPLAIRQAIERVRPGLSEARLRRSELKRMAAVGLVGLIMPILIAPLLVLLGFAFRGGMLLRAFGIALVTARGREASRGRALLRSILAWSPLLIVWLAALYLVLSQGIESTAGSAVPSAGLSQNVGWWVGRWGWFFGRAARNTLGIPMVVFLAGVIYAIASPCRALQDRLAGTYLVPR